MFDQSRESISISWKAGARVDCDNVVVARVNEAV